jgi:hypothetical protein
LCTQANVVCIDELPAFGCWEVVDVQIEERWSQNRALWEAIFLESPGAGVVSNMDPESPISQKQLDQLNEPERHSPCQFPTDQYAKLCRMLL